MGSDQAGRLHSAEFFGPERDHWWNLDHLRLIASRLGLDRVRTVLDVGSGVGHWGRLLSQALPAEARITGVDREPAWVLEATRRADGAGLGDRFRYEEGTAEALAFPDGSFDLVSCQTLLIHTVSPRAVIGEMLRVAKPGGLVIAAEPNSRASELVDTSTTAGEPVEEMLDRVRFLLTCERGKLALGEGNNSIGDLVPGYLAEQGALDVQTYMSDRPAALVPPYDSAEQHDRGDYVIREAANGTWGWGRDDALRYFLAGGGSPDSFDAIWERRLGERRRDAGAVADRSFHTAGGTFLYLIAGRKRSG